MSDTPGQHVPHGDWTWGRDEITWFSLLNTTCAFPHPSTPSVGCTLTCDIPHDSGSGTDGNGCKPLSFGCGIRTRGATLRCLGFGCLQPTPSHGMSECCSARITVRVTVVTLNSRYYARNASWGDAEAIAQAFEGGGSIGGNSLRAGCSMQLGDELVSVSKTWTRNESSSDFQTGTGARAAAYAMLHDSGLLALYWRGTLLWSSSA